MSIFSNINETNKFNFDLAYLVYSTVYDNWDKLSEKERKKARRQVEGTVRETGFNGTSTGMISKAAWQTILNSKKGIQPTKANRTALEHPITYTNIATYILNKENKLSYEEYFKVWFDTLITTITTNEENQSLRKRQANFEFPRDCWKKMYEDAGIELMERPRLMSHEEKRQWGVM